jgi:hypothetical protein
MLVSTPAARSACGGRTSDTFARRTAKVGSRTSSTSRRKLVSRYDSLMRARPRERDGRGHRRDVAHVLDEYLCAHALAHDNVQWRCVFHVAISSASSGALYAWMYARRASSKCVQ